MAQGKIVQDIYLMQNNFTFEHIRSVSVARSAQNWFGFVHTKLGLEMLTPNMTACSLRAKLDVRVSIL